MLPILPKIDTTTQEISHSRPQQQIRKEVPKKKETTETQSKPILPKLLLLAGMLLIVSQAIPLGLNIYKGYSLSANSSTFSPVSESFVQKLFSVAYIDPGSNWFEAVVAQSHASKIDTEYKKTLKLSINSAEISRVNLASNIPGNNPAIYDEALKHGVAHLKGTSVPGDPGLSVIYGHSGVAGFFTGRGSPQIIFSRLDSVSIGDTMSIERDGKELRYVVSGKKIIEPQDLTFMSEQTDKERAILLTCWPLGIGTKRLIIITDRIL